MSFTGAYRDCQRNVSIVTLRKVLVACFLALLFSIMIQLQDAPIASAAGVEAIWDGGGSDNRFSTAENWDDNTVPETGDTIVLNREVPGGVLNYDLPTTVKLAGIRLEDDGMESSSRYTISYKSSSASLRFQDGAYMTDNSPNVELFIGNDISAEGNLSLSGWYLHQTTTKVTGQLSLTNSSIRISKTSVHGATKYMLSGNSKLDVWSTGVKGDIETTAGSSAVIQPTFDNVTFYGDLDLSSDVSVGNSDGWDYVKFIGEVTGPGNVITTDIRNHCGARLLINSQVIQNEKRTVTLNGDIMSGPGTDVTLYAEETGVLNGSRDSIHLATDCSALIGSGEVNELSSHGGAVSPGGKGVGRIVINGSSSSAQVLPLKLYHAEYIVDIQNNKNYDQILVNGYYDTDHAPLVIRFSDETIIEKGDEFAVLRSTMGENGSREDASGFTHPSSLDPDDKFISFSSKIVVAGIVFAVEERGGDGGDLVLTALNGSDNPIERSDSAASRVDGVIASTALASNGNQEVESSSPSDEKKPSNVEEDNLANSEPGTVTGKKDPTNPSGFNTPLAASVIGGVALLVVTAGLLYRRFGAR